MKKYISLEEALDFDRQLVPKPCYRPDWAQIRMLRKSSQDVLSLPKIE